MKVLMIEPTPNPNAYKFVLDTAVSEKGAQQFSNREEARGNDLALALFGVAGVTSVFCARNFVTLTLAPGSTLDAVGPQVGSILERHRAPSARAVAGKGEGTKGAGPAKAASPEQSRLLARITGVLEQKVIPALAMDGGGVKVMGLEGKKLRIRYQGACGSCPGATMGTLMAIQSLLKSEVDPDLVVEPA
ncbi:MAG: NifU family protein [Planctomycetota bacterium]